MAIRGVLFDKDGTLIDAVGTWMPVYRGLLEEALQHRAHEWDAVFEAGGFDPVTETFRPNSLMASGTTDEFVDLWWPGLAADARAEKIVWVNGEFVSRSKLHLKPLMPLQPLLTQLRGRGLKTAVGTNDNEASAREHMRLLGASHLFDFICGYDSVPRAKPYGDMVHAFCAACDLAPAEVAVVGDNLHDLHMAHDAGAGLAIGVLTGNSGHADLAPHADVVLDSIADLPAYLEGR
jgi:phosphoglycolate phosphatase